MNKSKIIRFFCIVVICALCFLFLNDTIFAKINENYSQTGIQFEQGDGILEKILGFIQSLLL